MISLGRVVYFLVLAFPIVLLAVKPIAIIIFVAIVLIGLYISIRYRLNPFAIKETRLFSYLTVGYFAVMALSVAFSNEPTNDWTHLSRISYFLFAPFVAVIVYKVSISFNRLISSFKIGAIISGIIVFAQFVLSGGYGRFSGMYNPNTFGDLTVMLLLFSILNIDKEALKSYCFSLVAVFFGTTSVVLSGSRGSLIVLVFMLFAYALIMLIANRKISLRLLATMIFTSVVLAISLFGFADTSANRLVSISSEVSKWKSGDGMSSSGQRLEMYKAGIQAFADSPILGYGYYNCGSVAARYASKDTAMQKSFEGRWHLHNELLTNMVNAGIVGLGALLVLYMVPLLLFFRHLRNNQVASMGVILIVGYISLGLTHTLFGYEYETAFFVLMLAYSMREIYRQESKSA